jgi:Holliday junction resolvase RusA-like endonuclease
MRVTIWVPGKPATAGSKKFVGHTKTGRPIVAEDCKKSGPWKTRVKNAAKFIMKESGQTDLMKGPLNVYFTFYMARPKGHSGKHGIKPGAPRFPIVRPDVLKLSRAVEDALNDVLWHDDSQIVAEHITKLYCDTTHPDEGVNIQVFDL